MNTHQTKTNSFNAGESMRIIDFTKNFRKLLKSIERNSTKTEPNFCQMQNIRGFLLLFLRIFFASLRCCWCCHQECVALFVFFDRTKVTSKHYRASVVIIHFNCKELYI